MTIKIFQEDQEVFNMVLQTDLSIDFLGDLLDLIKKYRKETKNGK